MPWKPLRPRHLTPGRLCRIPWPAGDACDPALKERRGRLSESCRSILLEGGGRLPLPPAASIKVWVRRYRSNPAASPVPHSEPSGSEAPV
jgi:hypothetical protein